MHPVLHNPDTSRPAFMKALRNGILNYSTWKIGLKNDAQPGGRKHLEHILEYKNSKFKCLCEPLDIVFT